MLLETSDPDFAVLLDGGAPRGLKLPNGTVEAAPVLEMLRALANSIRPVFAPVSWMIVEDGEIVGLCSLVKSPSGDSVDVGYGIAETRRRRGHASAAIRALLEWARDDDRIGTVRAETSIHNAPSQRVLERNGFVRTGTRFDADDGDLICWAASVV